MSGTQGLPATFTNAVMQARLTGRPVPVPNPDGTPSTLIAQPNGGFSSAPSPGFAGTSMPLPPQPPAQQPAPSVLSAPSAITNRPVGSTVTWPPPWLPSWAGGNAAPTQATLNQANPAFTAGIQGLPGSPSGPAVAPPGGFQPPSVVPPTTLPTVEVHARRYRQAHGLATADDSAITDQLNAASLAAAQSGRNFLQPGPFAAAPPTQFIANALTTPPNAQVPTQQVAQNANALLQQGGY